MICRDLRTLEVIGVIGRGPVNRLRISVDTCAEHRERRFACIRWQTLTNLNDSWTTTRSAAFGANEVRTIAAALLQAVQAVESIESRRPASGKRNAS